jgi:hypothetical protein
MRALLASSSADVLLHAQQTRIWAQGECDHPRGLQRHTCFSRLGHSAAWHVGIPLVPRLAGSPTVQILLAGFEPRKDYGQTA